MISETPSPLTRPSDEIQFYATPGPLTDAGEHAALLANLPTRLPDLVRALQGLAVHIFWAQRYGLDLSDERKQEVGIRSFRHKLTRMLELDPAPLTMPRPYERRLVSNCRDFSVMIAGILMQQGRPARARCGFGTYFMPNHFEDHWVVEVWDSAESRWVMFDPQLDELMIQVLKPDFDPLDMGPGRFVTAGEAWLMCRREGRDPDQFGIFDFHGWDFIRGNLYRDLLALNKIEILPWDFWDGMGPGCDTFTPEDWARHDRLAEMAFHAQDNFQPIRNWYEGNPAIKVPEDWLK